MSQGLFSAVSGMIVAQTQMDVISNNIANMNTVGFKSSEVTFQDLLSKSMSTGTVPSGSDGGSNPIQVGLGTALGSINQNFTSGTIITTGLSSDLDIQGNGFFTLANPNGGIMLSRAGNFTLDSNGNLVNPNGMKVLGI